MQSNSCIATFNPVEDSGSLSAWRQTTTRTCGLLLAAFLPASLAQAADAPPRDVRVGVYENAPKLFLGQTASPAAFWATC